MTSDPGSVVARAAESLYAAPPEEFVSMRAGLVAEAKAARDTGAAREIGRLRKPSLAAWALNQVVRQRRSVVDDLVGLGARMREAQSRLDMATLAVMREDRAAALSALVTAASELGHARGRTLGPGTQDEVRDTGIAALADEAAARALVTGALTAALSYSGFGEVDLRGAVATTSTGTVLGVLAGGRTQERPEGKGDQAEQPEPAERAEQVDADTLAARTAAAAALTAAEEAVADAQQRSESATAAAAEAAADLADAELALEDATRRVAEARDAVQEAQAELTAATRARAQTERARHTAEQALARLT